MKNLKIVGLSIAGCLLIALLQADTRAAEGNGSKTKTTRVQATCPVMGGKIVKTQYADVNGKRIYVCCAGCIAKIKADPEKYIKKLEAAGVVLASTPKQLCAKCGEVKGQAKCCKTEGRKKCGKCDLLKGSPGCCKIPKGTKKPVDLCGKCGEIKGSKVCCKLKAKSKGCCPG
jgi:hypothetical protein